MELSYTDYLNSDEWKKKRAERLKLDNYECQCCGATDDLQIHHITYDRLGNENIDYDLITLCKKCHWQLHTTIEVYNKRVKDIKQKYQTEAQKAVKKTGDIWAEEAANIIADATNDFVGDKKTKHINTMMSVVKTMLRLEAGGCGAIYPIIPNPYSLAQRIYKCNKNTSEANCLFDVFGR